MYMESVRRGAARPTSTPVAVCDPGDADINNAGIVEAVAALCRGGLVVLPTETVYGLAADARCAEAVRRIFAVKDRPIDHPLIVHIGRANELDAWAVNIPPEAFVLATTFWPGPLTLVLRRHPAVLAEVTGGLETVAVRMPDHPVALAVLRTFGGALAAPSANRFGRVSPTHATDVVAELGPYLDPALDVVLDGGACAVGLESTIVDLTSPVPMILRPGAITAGQLAAALGEPVAVSPTGPSRAPGMLPAHYAPDARVEVVSGERLRNRASVLVSDRCRIAVLCPDHLRVAPEAIVLAAPRPYDAASLARVLYARLREADRRGAEYLLGVPPDDEHDPVSMAVAVLDRLQRAQAGSRGIAPSPSEA